MVVSRTVRYQPLNQQPKPNTMQTKTLNTGRVLVVKVYPGVKPVRVSNKSLQFSTQTSFGEIKDHISIPHGQWQLLGIGSEIKEEVWENVVGSKMVELFGYHDTPKESGLFLILHWATSRRNV